MHGELIRKEMENPPKDPYLKQTIMDGPQSSSDGVSSKNHSFRTISNLRIVVKMLDVSSNR